jgi:hypothetical protein
MSDHRSYAVLAYRFHLRCDAPEMADYASAVLARFEVDAAEASAWAGVPRYVVEDRRLEDGTRYRLYCDEVWLLGSDDPSHVLDHLFWHVNVRTIEQTRGLLLVHAGAVTTPDGRVALFPAPSGAGKTTLVSALVRAGFGYLSDEAAAIDPATSLVLPFPKALTVKVAAGAVFPELAPGEHGDRFVGSQWHVDPEAIRPASVAGPSEATYVIAYRYRPGAKTEVTAMSRAEACVELGQNAMNKPHHRGAALSILARVMERAAAYRLSSGDVGEAVDAVRRLTGG